MEKSALMIGRTFLSWISKTEQIIISVQFCFAQLRKALLGSIHLLNLESVPPLYALKNSPLALLYVVLNLYST